jgi:hypothetical protein
MNMSVSAISSSSDPYSPAVKSSTAQRRQEFQALASALKSGDLGAAQSAFASLQSTQPSASQSQAGQSSRPNSDQSANIQALASALQSGDIAGAQTAFAALQKGHGHHHHHPKAADSTAQTPSATSSPSNDPNQLIGTSLDVTA